MISRGSLLGTLAGIVSACVACSAVVLPPEPMPGPGFLFDLDPAPMSLIERDMDRVNRVVKSLGFPVVCSIMEDSRKTTLAMNTVIYGTGSCSIVVNSDAWDELRDLPSVRDAILGHEAGHSILSRECSHCTDGPDGELLADRVGGCVVATLGYGQRDANRAADYFGGMEGGTTHPPGSLRKVQVLAGYDQCSKSQP